MSIPHITIIVNILGCNTFNGSSNNRERGTMTNNGAKTSSASTNSGAHSDTNSVHHETLRTSNSSAALVNMNTDSSTKYGFYHQSHQKSTGTSSITSDSVTGNVNHTDFLINCLNEFSSNI